MSELSVQQIVESIQKELGLVKNTGIFYANQAAEHKILDEQRRKTDVWSAALRISAQILTTMKATVSNSMFLKPEETMTPDWNQRLQKHDYRQVLAEVARLTGLSIVSASRQSSDIVKIDTTRVGITDAGLNLGDAPFEKLFAQSAENKRLWDENLQTIADEFLQQVIQGFNQLEHKCFGLSLHVLIMLGGEDPPTGFFQLGGRQFHYSGLRKEQIDQITSLVNSKIAGGRVTIIKDATREGKLAVCLDSITNYVADPVFDYRAIRHLYNNTVSPELQVIVDEVIANTQPYSKDAQLLDTKTPRALVYPLKITKGNPHETFADNRLVTLTGEALFDVVAATDENGARVPFTVEADNLTVNVLGTIFRLVDGIEGVDTAAVSLYRGNVEVAIENYAEPERLFAGERLRVDTRTGDHGTELIPASEMALQGVMPLLRFEGATLGDLLLALELNHDVAITLDEGIDPSQGSYTADFEGMELDGVLRQVLDGTGLTHRIDGRNVLVTRQQVKVDDGVGAISAIWREVDAGESVMTRIVTFRSGSSVPQTDFMDNTRAFKELDNSLTDTATLARIDHISVTAASSPDGNTAGNERLAIARAQSTKGYLLKRYPHIAPGKVYTFSVGEEWSGLRKLVAEDLRTPDRDEVLALLDAVDDEKIRDTLRTISGGRAWRYIAARLLPRLRGATAVTLHFWDGASERRNDTVSVNNDIAAGTGVQRVEIVAAKPPKPQPVEEPVIEILKPVFSPLFAFKTNFLFDAVGALNLEIEVPLNERWSISAEGMFPWWWTANGTIEGRYWLGDRSLRPVLTGWFGGIYAGGGWYDFTRNDRAHKGDFFHAGLSGGYAHMINRRGNLRMEYSLGLGYLYSSGGRNWWGPTRGKVSLVWILEKRTIPSN